MISSLYCMQYWIILNNVVVIIYIQIHAGIEYTNENIMKTINIFINHIIFVMSGIAGIPGAVGVVGAAGLFIIVSFN
ncbi:MAG: hypothetical protein ACOZBL_03690 [Patescibacteria group bacterium]